MNIYLINIIIVLFIGAFQEGSNKYIVFRKHRYKLGILFSAITVFMLMFIEMGLRGDFSIDTRNYYNIFLYSSYEQSFWDSLVNNKDIGFFNIFMGTFKRFSFSFLAFLVVVAFIIAFAYTRFIKEYSEMFWLSALLLFCGGSFYTGFNVMRQILAAALVALSYKYIFTKEFRKYCFAVILITTLHLSAVVMIPMYFALTHKWNMHEGRTIKILGISLICILFYFFSSYIFVFVSQYFYTDYRLASAFGVNEGIGILGTFKAFVLAGGIIINSKYFDMNNIMERVIYNGCVIYLIIAACSANIFIVQRFTHYFVPCLLLAYPNILCKIQNRNSKRLLTVIVVVMFILSGINAVLDSNYYFYWDNKTIHWS